MREHRYGEFTPAKQPPQQPPRTLAGDGETNKKVEMTRKNSPVPLSPPLQLHRAFPPVWRRGLRREFEKRRRGSRQRARSPDFEATFENAPPVAIRRGKRIDSLRYFCHCRPLLPQPGQQAHSSSSRQIHNDFFCLPPAIVRCSCADTRPRTLRRADLKAPFLAMSSKGCACGGEGGGRPKSNRGRA